MIFNNVTMMKHSILLCLLEIQEKTKEASSSSLASSNVLTELTNRELARKQEEVFPRMLPHQREAAYREIAERDYILNQVDEAKRLLNPQDPDSEIPFTRMDQYKLDRQSSSVNRIHNLLLNTIFGPMPNNYGELLTTRDASLQRSRQLTNEHIEIATISKHIETLINEEEEALRDAQDASNEGSSSPESNGGSEEGNSPSNNGGENNNPGDNNQESNNPGNNNQEGSHPGNNNQEGNSPGNHNQEGNNNQGGNNTENNNQESNNSGNNSQGGNNQNSGSLIDDYADFSTEMPSYMDPED